MNTKIKPILKLGEYQLDKINFILIFPGKNVRSNGVKYRFEYSCNTCNKVYVTKLIDERRKEFPWTCRSCRTKKYWLKPNYRASLLAGTTDQTRYLRGIAGRKSWKKIWSTRRNEIVLKLRQRDPSVYSKCRRTMRHSQKVRHWKTGKMLVCVGSYEASFVRWCAINKIDFDWQIPHKMPDSRTYIIDSFIKSGLYAGNWIEIKGYMSKIGKEKWDWFVSKNPNNSLLWTQDVLIKLGIISK